jgi:signal transduction histidine kinase
MVQGERGQVASSSPTTELIPASFSVDTHLFRELGELLVGRDSTALIELIKNAYDADATETLVYAEGLDDLERGSIVIEDNGLGMTRQEFQDGFLRVASRLKVEGGRRSADFHRRYTGAKGIGRLAAHKLATRLEIRSEATRESTESEAIEATIDWDAVESVETFDQILSSGAVAVRAVPASGKRGTWIRLHPLRRRWSTAERARFLGEVQSFEPPAVLTEPLPASVVEGPVLFERPVVRETTPADPGINLRLEGEFAGGDDYWQALATQASWVIEIDASAGVPDIHYAIVPTTIARRSMPGAERREFRIPYEDPATGPFFQARILVREGAPAGAKYLRTWAQQAAGIRVFMEGFRVLPYGERNNDWLSIDADYTRRQRGLPWLDAALESGQPADPDAGLLVLRNSSYFGAVFLTETRASSLRMLVNREGFVPEAGYESLVHMVRTGIDLTTRVRAAARRETCRAQWRQRRERPAVEAPAQALQLAVTRVTELAHEARTAAESGDWPAASNRIEALVKGLSSVSQATTEFIAEGSMIRVLASVGTQMAAFVHEIRSLLATAEAVDKGMARIRDDPAMRPDARSQFAQLHQVVGDLRRSLERQASYLADVVTPDARRRRSRQPLADRFETARRLVERSAKTQSITIENDIPDDLMSPPMFPAELTTIFSNLLTNAVKAAGQDGRIRATGEIAPDRWTVVRIENTGVQVDLAQGERWFRPFESTTTSVDPVLGQGMGLGLPITRALTEEYGGTIRFVEASDGFTTSLELRLPAG